MRAETRTAEPAGAGPPEATPPRAALPEATPPEAAPPGDGQGPGASPVKSTLFQTTTLGSSAGRPATISSSSRPKPCVESTTSNTRSLSRAAAHARSTPIRSTGSPVGRKPAVSTRLTGTPSTWTRTWMASRVVPGTSVTIAESLPERAFRRLDLPTLGLPAITTRTPSARACPWAAPSRAAARVASTSPARALTADSSAPSSSSSGKSMAASTSARRSVRASPISPRRRDHSPSRVRRAARAASTVAASIRSATASAWTRSMRPLRKARSVNSPGRATRAPRARTRASRRSVTTGPPWPCSSRTSSPV